MRLFAKVTGAMAFIASLPLAIGVYILMKSYNDLNEQ
jgi:hypothetical protein